MSSSARPWSADVASSVSGKQDFCKTPLRRAERWDRGCLPANSGSCAQMRLRGNHLGATAALEGRKYSDATTAGVADRHDAVFDGDACPRPGIVHIAQQLPPSRGCIPASADTPVASMTSLRRRMTEDMQVRNLSPQTQATYVQQVSLFARHFNKSPEVLGPEEIRAYQVYLTNEKKLAPSSIIIAVAALRFFYRVTLRKDWRLEEIIPTPRSLRSCRMS
jgi:hypothetical protein